MSEIWRLREIIIPHEARAVGRSEIAGLLAMIRNLDPRAIESHW